VTVRLPFHGPCRRAGKMLRVCNRDSLCIETPAAKAPGGGLESCPAAGQSSFVTATRGRVAARCTSRGNRSKGGQSWPRTMTKLSIHEMQRLMERSLPARWPQMFIELHETRLNTRHHCLRQSELKETDATFPGTSSTVAHKVPRIESASFMKLWRSTVR